MNRAIKIDLIPPKESRQKIVASIREYRATARMLYSACAMAEIAGATITYKDDDIKIVPNKDNAKAILNSCFDNYDKNMHLYQLRSFVLREQNTSWKSFVWDAVRREVAQRWSAPDTEFPKAKRGYLTIQGARAIAKFNNIGIGMPFATAHPKLHEHKIEVGWDHTIGTIEFVIPKLDSARYYVWKSLRESTEGWKLGTIYLNERDNKVFLQMSFERPDIDKNIDLEKTLNVEFVPEAQNFICVYTGERNESDKIAFDETLQWLDEIRIVQERYESQRKSCGSKRAKWGNHKAWAAIQKRINNLTSRRENGCKSRNHLWTRRIIENAIRHNAGTIKLHNVPERELFGHPWGMFQFKSFLKYKIEEIGGKLI
jgi:transposase